ncbi:DUF262 domain-containing protein [Myroides sp. LJL115]
MADKITLKSIPELFGMNFFIPSYQRGYRWEQQQIIDLLNDILEFKRKENKVEGEFYCLQPLIVILKDKNEKKQVVYELVDGQQRLTTIYILLSYLSTKQDSKVPSDLFSIHYETREKENYSSEKFLKNICSTTQVDKTNIDFYRMSDAYLTIQQWFEQNKVDIPAFSHTLISNSFDSEHKDQANNIRFIWYPIKVDSLTDPKPNVTFAKYNQGKIDLTNAELIKAIFYLTDKDKKKHQIKIGYEWDDIENTLREVYFWRFINPSKNYLNHIEFIFDLVAEKYEKYTTLNINKSHDRYWSFHIFNDLISKNTSIYQDTTFGSTGEFLWDEIKNYYRTFYEWYTSKDQNNKYTHFHLIGFLLQIGGSQNKIEKIKELAESCSKSDFIDALKQKIKSHFSDVDLNEIGYERNYQKAKDVLLLFNIITTMDAGYNKFSFDRISSWSLEHIHAQQSQEITDHKQKVQLLEEQKVDPFIMKDLELSNEVNNLLESSEIDQATFNNLQKRILELSSDAGATIHSLKNLALLTPSDNSSLNNAPFYRKREKIKQLDQQGSFIPICTKNVFLKYYSENVDQNLKWTKEDMEGYLKEMKNTLTDYITIK